MPNLGFAIHRSLRRVRVDGGPTVVADLLDLVHANDLDRDVVVRAALHRHLDEVLTGFLGRVAQNGFADLVLCDAAVDAIATLHEDVALVNGDLVEVDLHGGVLTNQSGQHGAHVTGCSLLLGQQAHLHLHSHVGVIAG